MNTADDTPQLNPCGCCQTGLPEPEIKNRPGLPALSYRIGTHPDFLRRMLARLPAQTVPPEDVNGQRPLARLATRALDDPAISLLDAWAVVADVLTFYQERIANEGFLRTASERRSVLELARAIGYELNPGVAASSFLAFTVETGPGAPTKAIVPQGTKVQSLPGPGQQPQTFETSSEMVARPEWNVLRPRVTHPQILALAEKPTGKTNPDGTPETKPALYLLGLDPLVPVKPPDVIALTGKECYLLDPTTDDLPDTVPAIEVKQVYLPGTDHNLKPGDLLLLAGKNSDAKPKVLALPISQIVPELEFQRTRVDLETKLEKQPSPPPEVPPPVKTSPVAIFTAIPLIQQNVTVQVKNKVWRESDLAAFVSVQGWDRRKMVAHVNRAPPPAPPAPPPPAPPPETKPGEPPAHAEVSQGLFGFQERVGFFGHNAPAFDGLVKGNGDKLYGDKTNWDPNGWEVWKDWLTSSLTDKKNYVGADVFFERTLSGLTDGSWTVFQSPFDEPYTPFWITGVKESSVAGFSLSAKANGVNLASFDGADVTENDKDVAYKDFKVRTTTAHILSRPLALAPLPLENKIGPDAMSLTLDRMVQELQIGQPVALIGEREDLPGVTDSEVLILSDIIHSGGLTTLFFEAPGLKHPYLRKTVTLNANVARATHGDTVTEVLGSGDGAQSHLTFTLKRPPLTYVSAGTASGAQSTLRLRVNGVLWEETPRLYGLDERSENFIVRLADDGRPSIIFGDGAQGARLPTGVENVTATYRSGIGAAGMVGPDRLTLLLSRPLGIRSVTNPLATTGAAEPESRDDARDNAPLTVLTLERIVSLQDYEDFTRGFAGIGKAQAMEVWRGETRWVHLTIAAKAAQVSDDAESTPSALASHVVEDKSDLLNNLIAAIQDASDPVHPFRIDSYLPAFFNLKARVRVQPRYDLATVLARAADALKAAFDFKRRAFGQPVTMAEVVTAIQSVTGVVAVDLDQFYRFDNGPNDPTQPLPELLEAAQAAWGPGEAKPVLAELLLINPVGITLEEMKP